MIQSVDSSTGRVGKILLLAYAFPPIHVQVSPVAARLAAGLDRLGFAVDVICADPSVWPLPRDEGLLPYVEQHCRSVRRLLPKPSVLRRAAHCVRRLRDLPDCMEQLHSSAFDAVMETSPYEYDAVMTVSPFHSVNAVMTRVKQVCPRVHWIAHFCDPWATNPLEDRWDVRHWNAWAEPRAFRAASYVTNTSQEALEQCLARYPFLPRKRVLVVPHVFDPALYPSRPRRRSQKFVLRFIGTLFGRRSPEAFFKALRRLLDEKPDLAGRVEVEFVGKMETGMLERCSALALPEAMVRSRAPVPYLESLELMFDADVLLVIEADVAATPFVPSKVTDYMGAGRPIIGISPRGSCSHMLRRLGSVVVEPGDIAGIAGAIETAIVQRKAPPANEEFRSRHELVAGTSAFLPLIGARRA